MHKINANDIQILQYNALKKRKKKNKNRIDGHEK